MTTAANHVSRLSIKLPPRKKALVEKAAKSRGQTVSEFAAHVLTCSAEAALQEDTERVLSPRDSKIFLAMSAEPNEALKRAAEWYKKRRA